MTDGTRLAARLWLPEGSETTPVPAVLEYVPYRKRDMTAWRDWANHGYLAGHGYACIRLDVRGTGDSDGLFGEQFSALYAEDAAEAVAWIAAQPWCSGEVAMFGLSWGAGIALQTAALQPPALKTIICASGLDDRFASKFAGGTLLANNAWNIPAWVLYATRPPDPAIVGEGWRRAWLERLEACTFTGESWFVHQCRDEFWQQASVRDRIGRIRCPIFAISGWADQGFASSTLRILTTATAPRRGLIGPWSHRYPHVGQPGPAIGYLQEVLRWLDHWTKRRANGAMDEPGLRLWVPEGAPPNPRPDVQTGRWIGAPGWSEVQIEQRILSLTPDWLSETPGRDVALTIDWNGGVGSAGGEWMPIFTTGANPEMADDQRRDDERSTVFDSAPLGTRLELVGAPTLILEVSAETAIAHLVARLCDLAPDGSSRRVTFGALNLVHRDGVERPSLLEPGQRYLVRLQLYEAAYCFPPGHRLRLGLTTSYWPMIWPSPVHARVTLHLGRSSRLALPVLRNAADAAVLMPPETAPPVTLTTRRPARYERRDVTDAEGSRSSDVREDFGAVRYGDIDIEADEVSVRRCRLRLQDPASAEVEAEAHWTLARGNWRVGGSARTVVSSAHDAFTIRTHLEAKEGATRIFSRDWSIRVPRRFV
ncbi:MAG: CocE/NonD family hydrolase [Proteobacteria bacterium]|nr:CocE/NonD family hydrolase [Pseudomonadota bacterium]